MSEQQLPPGFTILALETSCDETAAAVIRDGRLIVSNVVASQIDEHRRYGGVVPEVASRQHILSLQPVVEQALAPLPQGWDDVHAVAATYGPGLPGALLVGLNAAKGLAWGRRLPFVGVNHLEGHIYANWLIPEPAGTVPVPASPPALPSFPLVALIVSGGHTVLLLLRGHGQYELLGQTRDDAAGEAFDKSARIMGLGYPGGPAIQQAARTTSAGPTLPRAWLRDSYDFSFSGLKTAVLRQVEEHRAREAKLAGSVQARPPAAEPERFIAQLAHAFQESVVDVLAAKTVEAAQRHGAAEILLAGGVAANQRLRDELARRAQVPVRYPPLVLCTDNAAMIAAAAYYRFDAGVQTRWNVDVQPNLKIADSR